MKLHLYSVTMLHMHYSAELSSRSQYIRLPVLHIWAEMQFS